MVALSKPSTPPNSSVLRTSQLWASALRPVAVVEGLGGVGAAGASAGPGDGPVGVGGHRPVPEGFGAVPASCRPVQVRGCSGAVGVDVVEVLPGDRRGGSGGGAGGEVAERDVGAH